MLVSGTPLTLEQAEDIILKTDSFLTDPSEYSGGNARQFNNWYREIAGLNELRNACKDDFRKEWDLREKLREKLGCIDTEYVHNCWASSAFVYGPHGWCHPDGQIGYLDNVGKWPSVEEVEQDWIKLATAFPYIDIHVTLMSGEGCEDHSAPVVNMRVVGGKVELCKGDESVHTRLSRRSRDDSDLEEFAAMINNTVSREVGLSTGILEKYASQVKSVVTELLNTNN